MPSWNELTEKFDAQGDDEARKAWLVQTTQEALTGISDIRGRNVLIYGSAFLQKPQVPAPAIILTHEDMNGFMSTIYGMDWSRGLTLLLHTPGGDPNAAAAVVDYLRSKFKQFEVIVPSLAMSAGTMISLGSDKIVMGRQSQLGPIDPQLGIGGRSVSARAVVEQFERASREVKEDLTSAHVWAPILQSLGPALLQEAQNALDYSESMVAGWLSKHMLSGSDDPTGDGQAVAHHFNDASTHKSHGRRINRDEARSNKVAVEDLEDDQTLQEHVLTAHHMMTIYFERSQATKLLWSHTGRTWLKNWAGQAPGN